MDKKARLREQSEAVVDRMSVTDVTASTERGADAACRAGPTAPRAARSSAPRKLSAISCVTIQAFATTVASKSHERRVIDRALAGMISARSPRSEKARSPARMRTRR